MAARRSAPSIPCIPGGPDGDPSPSSSPPAPPPSDTSPSRQVRAEPVFRATLDYIFYGPPAGPLRLRSVEPLPAVAAAIAAGAAAAPLPNDSEPSDHVLIAADFDLA